MYKYLKFVLPAVVIAISQPANSTMTFDDTERSNDFFTPREVLKLCLQESKVSLEGIQDFVKYKKINKNSDETTNDLLEKINTSMHDKLKLVDSLDKKPIATIERLISLLESPYLEFIETLKSDDNIDNLQQDEFNELVSNIWENRFLVKGGDYIGYQTAIEKLINLGVIGDIAEINEIKKNGNNFLKEEIDSESAITSTGLRFANGPILWNIKQVINYRPIRKRGIDKDDL